MFSLNQAIQYYFKPIDGPVRVSCANLVTHVRAEGVHGPKKMPIAILNRRALQKGERKWQAVGGAANLSRTGVRELEKCFGALNFEIDEKNGMADARFVISGSILQEAVRWLIAASNDHMERDPSREFQSELGISSDYMEGVTFVPLGVAIQPPTEIKFDTSSRAIGRPPTRRIFRCFEAQLPNSAWYAIWGLKNIRFMSENEHFLTEGGKHGAILSDGSILANNLGVPISYS